ncbi:hypothetical protein EJF18_30436 [Clavispora lusitaniae]|uniref:Uncharacterized protein n=1 Tax=Clavispora lusitaniae TaxID=36911 RepID=A0ACD0WJ38_CLALS|nr:hypothetical protein EJF14_30436 [Clavispora lusitaniae]QFZ33227.1 hypothetical protein EJF16_30436 [Clavispora lusitaniae]QFZ38898.1 hypothetical protein EJF15_30436 [Clavispora lusitaniae]QFZ44580.1 hypothetical protein EJF18_30436 [Clavispora lusitaniae]QFZ50257.1 hypothetical protein EJF17_30436 [Clavispora lusitaniae]
MSMLRFLARLHTAEAVSTRDLFLESAHVFAGRPQTPSLFARSATDFTSLYLDGEPHNENISESLRLDPAFQNLLEARTSHIQNFVGPRFPLSFADLLCVACGLANMSVSCSSSASALENVSIQQSTLRAVGKRYFLFQAQTCTTFADMGHLSAHHKELEHALSLLDDSPRLICDFMKQNSLYDAVIPYRGAHAAGPVSAEEAKRLRSLIRNQTCVGSFYTLLGLLTTKFDKDAVREHFWNSRVLDPNTGIIRIATDNYNRSQT